MMVAWLQARGVPLYSEVMTVQPPMLFQPTAWLFALWGSASTGARSVEIGYAVLGIVAVAWAGKLLGRPAIGLVAALFLSLEMRYFVYSRVFIGSVSSAAVGALAVLFALYFQTTGRRRWLLLAGVTLSFSLLIKPLSLPVGLLLVWIIIARRRSEVPATAAGRLVFRSFPWREALLDCLYLGVAGLILPILCLVLYDGAAMLRILIGVQSTRFERGTTVIKDLLGYYVPYNRPVLLLAALGIIQTIRRRSGLGVTVILWLMLNLVFIVATGGQHHHLVLLDLPLALLAAYAVGELGNLARMRRLWPAPWTGLAAASLLVYYLVTLPTLVAPYTSELPRGLAAPANKERLAAVRLLQKVTTPDQFVVSDDQELVFEARRMAVPALIDPSRIVIRSGMLKEQTIIQVAERQASAFVFWTNRFTGFFEALPVWAGSAYAASEGFGAKRIIYYNKQTPRITHPLSLAFNGEIALAGYELSQDTPPQVTLYWKRLASQVGEYKVSLCLLDTAGNVAAKRDRRPFGGHFDTTSWPIGVLLPEQMALPSLDALPPGRYSLVIGLYDPDKSDEPELLPITGGPVLNNLALLEVFTLGSR